MRDAYGKLQGTVPSTDFTVNATHQSITFGPSILTVPNAVITFTSKVSCASTTFNTTTHEWETRIPLSYATHADEIFSAGLAHILPANFPQNVSNVTWHVTFTSPTAPSLQFQFQYGAANYLSNKDGEVFPTEGGQPDYNAMMIDPAHNAPTCNRYNSGDHAGTPENSVVKSRRWRFELDRARQNRCPSVKKTARRVGSARSGPKGRGPVPRRTSGAAQCMLAFRPQSQCITLCIKSDQTWKLILIQALVLNCRFFNQRIFSGTGRMLPTWRVLSRVGAALFGSSSSAFSFWRSSS